MRSNRIGSPEPRGANLTAVFIAIIVTIVVGAPLWWLLLRGIT